jgi:hypothetical protein
VFPSTWIARFFASLPKWAQVAAMLGTIFGILSTAGATTSIVYQRIYHKGMTTEQIASKAIDNANRLQEVDNRSAKNDNRIRLLEDHNLVIDGEFKALHTQIDTFRDDINHRLDRVFDEVKHK